MLEKLKARMNSTFKTLHQDYVKKRELDFRNAAYLHAIKRLLQAERDRGRI